MSETNGSFTNDGGSGSGSSGRRKRGHGDQDSLPVYDGRAKSFKRTSKFPMPKRAEKLLDSIEADQSELYSNLFDTICDLNRGKFDRRWNPIPYDALEYEDFRDETDFATLSFKLDELEALLKEVRNGDFIQLDHLFEKNPGLLIPSTDVGSLVNVHLKKWLEHEKEDFPHKFHANVPFHLIVENRERNLEVGFPQLWMVFQSLKVPLMQYAPEPATKFLDQITATGNCMQAMHKIMLGEGYEIHDALKAYLMCVVETRTTSVKKLDFVRKVLGLPFVQTMYTLRQFLEKLKSRLEREPNQTPVAPAVTRFRLDGPSNFVAPGSHFHAL